MGRRGRSLHHAPGQCAEQRLRNHLIQSISASLALPALILQAARGSLGDHHWGCVLVVSSSVFNEIISEPTVLAVPIFSVESDTGSGIDVGGGWAAPGLVASLAENRLERVNRQVDVQALTDVTTMLFRIWPRQSVDQPG